MALRETSSRFLLQAAFAPSTWKAYWKGVSDFVDWCLARNYDFEDEFSLDELLTDYFHWRYDTGQSRSGAAATLHGVLALFPHYKSHLRLSALALRGWSRICPPVSYPPLTWDLTCVVAVQLTRSGDWRLGVGVLLSFDCYLRAGELLQLRVSDVVEPGDARAGSVLNGMALRLRRTKTGPNKWVEVRRDCVKVLLRWVLARTAADSCLFPVSYAVYRKCFKRVIAGLGLSPQYTLHSLRHGGATHDCLGGMTVESIMLRGRWVSGRSAALYIQSGRALLLSLAVPRAIARAGAMFAQDVVFSFSLAQLHSVRVSNSC